MFFESSTPPKIVKVRKELNPSDQWQHPTVQSLPVDCPQDFQLPNPTQVPWLSVYGVKIKRQCCFHLETDEKFF